MADRPEHDDVPEGPVPRDEALTDDEILEAEAIAEGDPADDPYVGADDEIDGAGGVSDQEPFVDGTVGRSDLAAERDEYLDALRRVKAEFDNFKKRTSKERIELTTRANASLVDKLLPVLDACEAAISHGAADVDPIYKTMLDVLEKEGLERMPTDEVMCDPNLHDAVMHEPGEGAESVVVDTFRTGYLWKGQVIRPAMVKVQG
jgi:molecular chaperone GrpE